MQDWKPRPRTDAWGTSCPRRDSQCAGATDTQLEPHGLRHEMTARFPRRPVMDSSTALPYPFAGLIVLSHSGHRDHNMMPYLRARRRNTIPHYPLRPPPHPRISPGQKRRTPLRKTETHDESNTNKSPREQGNQGGYLIAGRHNGTLHGAQANSSSTGKQARRQGQGSTECCQISPASPPLYQPRAPPRSQGGAGPDPP